MLNIEKLEDRSFKILNFIIRELYIGCKYSF